jgi:hypothetical protein
MDEREVLEAERERLTEIIARIRARLDELAATIGVDGQMLVGSRAQPVAHPLLRIETGLRVELRRASTDLRTCESRLATLDRQPKRPDLALSLGRNPRHTGRS